MRKLPDAFLAGLAALEESYLRETDPVRQSGFGGGRERWREERGVILDAVDEDGDFLDVGCANGYLVECLTEWASERGVRLVPYGVDIGERLIDLARRRLPTYASHFWAANAWDWTPLRRFRYVYTLCDCVPEGYLAEYVSHLLRHYVTADGIVIVGAYGSLSRSEPALDVGAELCRLGFEVEGTAERGDPSASRIAWVGKIKGLTLTARAGRDKTRGSGPDGGAGPSRPAAWGSTRT